MKSVTLRGFYHNAGLVEGLADGSRLLVTAKGKPKFLVTRTPPPRMSAALAEKRAVGEAQSAKIDGAAFINSLKK
jgi:hypothetical protein